jgi:hypothetical protein
MRSVIVDTPNGDRRLASWRGAVIVADEADAAVLAAMLPGLHPEVVDAPPADAGDSLSFAAWLCLTHEDPVEELP